MANFHGRGGWSIARFQSRSVYGERKVPFQALGHGPRLGAPSEMLHDREASLLVVHVGFEHQRAVMVVLAVGVAVVDAVGNPRAALGFPKNAAKPAVTVEGRARPVELVDHAPAELERGAMALPDALALKIVLHLFILSFWGAVQAAPSCFTLSHASDRLRV